jgi:hypothetical protein
MKLDRFTILCNGAGAFLALLIGGYFASSLIREEQTAACGEHFPIATSLPLETAFGSPLSTIELQARAGRREYGLLDNARVVRAADAPSRAVLEVSLGTAHPGERNGIGMRWSPPGLSEARAACLSYAVWLPKDFEFGGGGFLPGLFGGAETEDLLRPDTAAGFAARPSWRTGGALQAVLQLPSASGGATVVERGRSALPRGRWVGIDQELRLNNPGKADGELRVWIDRELMLERRAVKWQTDGAPSIGGIVALVGHGTLDRASGVRSASAIRLTPFDLRWR